MRKASQHTDRYGKPITLTGAIKCIKHCLHHAGIHTRRAQSDESWIGANLIAHAGGHTIPIQVRFGEEPRQSAHQDVCVITVTQTMTPSTMTKTARDGVWNAVENLQTA